MRIDPRADRNLIAAFGSPEAAGGVSPGRWGRPRHPAMQLLRAVMALAGPEAELIRHAERVWASVTFSGTPKNCASLRRSASSSFLGLPLRTNCWR